MENNKSNRLVGIDILKFLATFLVVCIHAPFKGEIGKCIVAIARCAVPIFFMITGFFYQQTVKKGKENKQIIKILKLCIISNLLFLIFEIIKLLYNNGDILSYLQDTFSIKNIIKWILFNESPIYGHLWYLSALLYVLIIMKFLSKLEIKVYKIIPLLLIADLIFGKYSLLVLKTEIPYIYVRNFLFVGIPYFCIGDYINKKTINKDLLEYRKYFAIMTLIFLVTTVLERLILIRINCNAVRDHYISTTFLSISAFLLFYTFKHRKRVLSTIVSKISINYSTGIYVLHPMIIAILSGFLADKTWYTDCMPIVIFIITVIIVALLTIIKDQINFIILKRRRIK